MVINKRLIDDALQQMTGFRVGRWGGSPRELISSMGLEKEEWEYIKKHEESGHLDEDDIEEINEEFAESTKGETQGEKS